jgi:hypothetical protein
MPDVLHPFGTAFEERSYHRVISMPGPAVTALRGAAIGWVRVSYPEQCKVLVGDEEMGNTNRLIYIGVDATHTISLALSTNFKPKSQKRRVINTSRQKPLELSFEPPE